MRRGIGTFVADDGAINRDERERRGEFASLRRRVSGRVRDRIREYPCRGESVSVPRSALPRHCASVGDRHACWHLTRRYRSPVSRGGPAAVLGTVTGPARGPAVWWIDRDFVVSPAIYRASRLFVIIGCGTRGTGRTERHGRDQRRAGLNWRTLGPTIKGLSRGRSATRRCISCRPGAPAGGGAPSNLVDFGSAVPPPRAPSAAR